MSSASRVRPSPGLPTRRQGSTSPTTRPPTAHCALGLKQPDDTAKNLELVGTTEACVFDECDAAVELARASKRDEVVHVRCDDNPVLAERVGEDVGVRTSEQTALPPVHGVDAPAGRPGSRSTREPLRGAEIALLRSLA